MQASSKIAVEAQQAQQQAMRSKKALAEYLDAQVRGAVEKIRSDSSCNAVPLPPMSKDEREMV